MRSVQKTVGLQGAVKKENRMGYQKYAIVRLPEPETGMPEYRLFSVPVRSESGRWVSAGTRYEETHLYDEDTIAIDVHFARQHGTATEGGALDGIPAPDGWGVVTKEWLPDDYTPPSKQELRQRDIDMLRDLKGMGAVDQDFDPLGEQ
jgi:hypothetical protein